MWGGSKNYLGFAKETSSNLIVYADLAPATVGVRSGAIPDSFLPASDPLRNGWDACAMSYGTTSLPADLADVWTNNTCITASGSRIFSFNGCHNATPNDGNIPLFSNNKYLNDDGTYVMSCGNARWSLADAQAAGVDIGSTLGPSPSTAQIMQMAKDLLGF